MPRRSRAQTERTRTEILARAVDLASIRGLEGLTVGRLADAIFMSKSGLFSHFGSKEELQVATIEHARDHFDREVTAQVEQMPAGAVRLRSLAGAWLDYIEKGVWRGGCFFFAVGAEMDDRPGRVRDRIVELSRSWLGLLERDAEAGRDLGQLRPDQDPAQLAFEIHAFLQGANAAFQLHGDGAVFDRARRAVDGAIELATATPPRAATSQR